MAVGINKARSQCQTIGVNCPVSSGGQLFGFTGYMNNFSIFYKNIPVKGGIPAAVLDECIGNDDRLRTVFCPEKFEF